MTATVAAGGLRDDGVGLIEDTGGYERRGGPVVSGGLSLRACAPALHPCILASLPACLLACLPACLFVCGGGEATTVLSWFRAISTLFPSQVRPCPTRPSFPLAFCGNSWAHALIVCLPPGARCVCLRQGTGRSRPSKVPGPSPVAYRRDAADAQVSASVD